VATKLYFEATTAAPITTGPHGAWETTAAMRRRKLRVGQQAATEENVAFSIGADANSNACAFQLISDPLEGAQTISGTYNLVTKGNEVAGTDNVNKRWRGLYVVSGDGATLRGTLDALAATASTTELTSGGSGTGQSHAVNGGLTSVNALDGDRIVVEIGYGVGTSGTTPQADMIIGGSGTDHANANNDATGTVPWMEFSANLVFEVAAVARTPHFNSPHMGRW
jgi:hypothetical protein